jgi:hypothetical protein
VSLYAERSMTISPGDQTRSAQVPLDLAEEAFGFAPIRVEVAPAVLEIFAPVSKMSGEPK